MAFIWRGSFRFTKTISGITQRRLRELIFQALEEVEGESLVSVYDVDPTYPRAEALGEVHFPGEMSQVEASPAIFREGGIFSPATSGGLATGPACRSERENPGKADDFAQGILRVAALRPHRSAEAEA